MRAQLSNGGGSHADLNSCIVPDIVHRKCSSMDSQILAEQSRFTSK